MSRKNLILAAAAVVLLALGGLGYYLFQSHKAAAPEGEQAAAPGAPAPIAKGQVPAPIFLILDKDGVVRFSKAGQDIARQVQPMVSQAEAAIRAQRDSIQHAADQLRNDASIAGPERDKRMAALQAREQALQADAQRRQAQIQDAIARANAQVSKVLQEVVPPLVKQRGANMVLDRSALPQANPDLDITPDVIKALDARMPSVAVTLQAPAPAPATK